MVLLSDGADNSGGIDLDTISALRNRHIPVHTVGFGLEQDRRTTWRSTTPSSLRARWPIRASPRASVSISAATPGANPRSRFATATKSWPRAKSLSAPTARSKPKIFCSTPAPPGAKPLQFSIDAFAGEQNRANNAVTRLVNVESDKRRILYVEGEPRWEYKFIRRAEDDDRIVQVASMLRTTENKIYRQGINDPKELADGFPAAPRTSSVTRG